jgi:Ca-activated chloride channel family protein
VEGEIPVTSRHLLLLLLILLVPVNLKAQKGRAENSEANTLYQRGLYEEALRKYQKALEKNPDSAVIKFNSGDAQYQMKAFEKALEAFEASLVTEDQQLRAHSFYNRGNTLYRNGDLQGAVESYKEALRLNPNDLDAKYNLEYVLKQLESQPQEEQEQQNRDQEPAEQQEEQSSRDQDDSQDQQGESPDQSQQGESQEPPDQDQQGDTQETPDQDQQSESRDQPQESQEETGDDKNSSSQLEPDRSQQLPMTREQAQQILEALREDQKDLLRRRTIRPRPAEGGKDW